MGSKIKKLQEQQKPEYSENCSVFMYGSNLDPKRLSKRIISWDGSYERASLLNHELRFNMFAEQKRIGANIVPHSTRKVHGIIVSFHKDELHQMDGYEGYPYLYNRAKFELETENNFIVEAYTYFAQSEWLTEDLLPDEKYLKCIIDGACLCGLPDNYIKAIEKLGKGLI